MHAGTCRTESAPTRMIASARPLAIALAAAALTGTAGAEEAPARTAQILVNGEVASGKAWAEKRGAREASSACLAWSETWVKPR